MEMNRFQKYAKSEKGLEARKRAQDKYNSSNKAKERAKKYYENNSEKILYRQRARKHSHTNSWLLTTAKSRAKKKNIEFSITLKDIIIPDVCPILGIPLFCSENRHSDNSPSLDRIRSEQGYVVGNVQVISYRANMLKNNGTIEEFEKIINHIKNI